MSLETFFEDTAENYLDWVKDWEDPNPKPVLKEHEGFIVVRDDLLGAGSKIRGVDYLVALRQDMHKLVFLLCVVNMEKRLCYSWPKEIVKIFILIKRREYP
jgi:hypothetical protein